MIEARPIGIGFWNEAQRGAKRIVSSATGEAERAAGRVRRAVEDTVADAEATVREATGIVTGARDPKKLLTLLVDSIEFQSDYTPGVRYSIEELLADKAEKTAGAGWALRKVKPTVVIRLRQGLGTKVIAPGGRADPSAWTRSIKYLALGGAGAGAVLLGVFGAGYLLGRR